MTIELSFLSHIFSKDERTWLEFVSKYRNFDLRKTKAKLHGKIAKDFEPNSINSNFYTKGRLTILGIRLFRQDDPILDAIDKIARYLKQRVLEDPEVDYIYVSDIENAVGESQRIVSIAIMFMSKLGNFFSDINMNAHGNPYWVSFHGDNGYDEILRYEELDMLFEQSYKTQIPWDFNIFDDNPFIENKVNYHPTKKETFKPNSAFIIMSIDPSKPELEDVLEAIKGACIAFDIKAYRADEIEHQDRITNVILEEIKTSEFLIADLSRERPNVYYEIGYAHALNKQPILFRKQGTKLHFDLSVHNVPEYRNVTELRELIVKRFKAILGKSPTDI